VRESAVSEPESQQKEVPSRLLYHWIKSSLFRVVHADGAYGGVTSRGYLNFSLYNERAAIPRVSERDVTVGKDGAIVAGPERTTDSREGFVREVEVEVLMDYRTAVEFLEWLKQKVEIMDKLRKEAKTDADASK
jgi:hypothetical protein